MINLSYDQCNRKAFPKGFMKRKIELLRADAMDKIQMKSKSQMIKGFTPAEGAQFVRYFGPLLDALRKLGGSGAPSEVVDQIAEDLRLSEEIRNEMLDSGTPRFSNQVAWARFYLTREGLLDSSKRGVWSLTEKGISTRLSPEEARAVFLKWVKIFSEERKKKRAKEMESDSPAPETAAPVVADFRQRLSQILLSLPPGGFERLCQRLLRESGFVQVVVTGRSGDGGIDGYGTLQVNPLVSFRVLFQCKRFTNSVTPSHVRDFRGAMQGRADKGIIMTTGSFTSEARKEATRDGVPPIELLDGQKMIDMFVDLELGLKAVTTYEVNEDFFNDFRERGAADRDE